jgi:hypothetical protein
MHLEDPEKFSADKLIFVEKYTKGNSAYSGSDWRKPEVACKA